MDKTIVTVTLTDREDGGLFVTSEELPGLILSGSDKHDVCDCIGAGIAAIFRHKGYSDVTVEAETPLSEALRMPSPRSVDMQVQRFIVEFKRAA